MPIIDAYETTYGKIINKARIAKEIREYYVRSDVALNYEYNSGCSTGLCFITGYSKEEQDLILFDHPVLFKDIKENWIVAVDLRKFVKSIKDDEQPISIQDVAKDQAGLDFSILRGLLVADFLDHNYGVARPLYQGMAVGYGCLLGKLLNIYTKLNPDEQVEVEIAAALFCSSLTVDMQDLDDTLLNIIARISNYKYSIGISKHTIEQIASKLYIKGQSLDDLLDLIKQVLPEEKAQLINDSVLINLLSNMWFGPGGNETLIVGLEHLPTWIATSYISLQHTSYKRARLSQFLNSISRQLDSKEYIKNIELYLKEKKTQE